MFLQEQKSYLASDEGSLGICGSASLQKNIDNGYAHLHFLIYPQSETVGGSIEDYINCIRLFTHAPSSSAATMTREIGEPTTHYKSLPGYPGKYRIWLFAVDNIKRRITVLARET